MSKFFYYFKQEFRLIFSDSAIVTSYLMATLFVSILYSYIYSNQVVKNISIAVVDQENSQMSHMYSRMLDAAEQINVTNYPTSLKDAESLFENHQIQGIVAIPPDFSKDIQLGSVPTISVYCDASYMLYYKQVFTAISTTTATFSAQIEVKKIMSQGIPQKQAVDIRRPIEVISQPLFNIKNGYGIFIIPIVLLLAIQILQLTSMGLMGGTQRERKIFHKLFPDLKNISSSIFLLLGRSMVYLIISFLLIIIEIGLIMPLFNLPQRANPLEILLFLIPFILSITFLGFILMSFYTHREDSLMYVTIFSIPMLFLCGVSWPINAFPDWIKWSSCFVPSTLGVRGFIEMSQFGASFLEVKSLYFQLWILSLFYFIIAVWAQRRIFFISADKIIR